MTGTKDKHDSEIQPMRLILVPLAIAAFVISMTCGRAFANPGHASVEVLRNDNRTPAGRMQAGVLTVSLIARRGIWHPEAAPAPGIEVSAFAVEGGALTNPGPLLRVRAGTQINTTLHNALLSPLTVHGLGSAVLLIPPGESRTARFVADAPGTFLYWATTTGAPLERRFSDDSQMNGALVVDPPGAVLDDRVFVITHHEVNQYEIWAINGASWPDTERLFNTVGDTVRWRWINASFEGHPLHLHGHYFRVDGTDKLVVTQFLGAGAAMAMGWTPDRAGNWLFHCHIIDHVAPELSLTAAPDGHASHDPEHHMAGLVLGIIVAPRTLARTPEPPPARRLSLLVGERPGVRYGEDPGLGYALAPGGDPLPVAPLFTAPGPPIVLTRGESVEITIDNRLASATSVHWHGIELESYYDGVPGWTGTAGKLSPSIEPGGSFAARFAPPRAGSFMYHTHFDDKRQLTSGLYGALIVVDPAAPFDASTDKVFVYGQNGPSERHNDSLVLNGSAHPPPLSLQVGVVYRLRLMCITSAPEVALALTRGGVPIRWRALAKDGAELSAATQTAGLAEIVLSPGETRDYEVRFDQPGDLRLEASINSEVHADTEFRVR